MASVLASVAVAASGLAALQLTRQHAGAAGTVPPDASSAALDMTAPQLIRPVQPKQAAPASASPQRRVVSIAIAPFPQEYRVLLARSVFLNQPGQRVRGASDSGGGGGPRSYEASLTFRGVMRDGGESVAFIDDGSRTMRLKIGDKIGRGEIREISLNELVYQVGDRTIPVQIGMNLTGTGMMSSRPATQPSSTPDSPGATASSGSSSSSGGDDVLERMRKRRQQEGGM